MNTYAATSAALEQFNESVRHIAEAVADVFQKQIIPALVNAYGALPMQTRDELAFLVALKADPRDRTSRLVYADWLDEADRALDAALQRVLADPAEDGHRLAYAAVCDAQGDGDRAEFVRVQVELAQMPAASRQALEGVTDIVGSLDAILPHVALRGGTDEMQKVVMDGLKRLAHLTRRERELLRARRYGWLDGMLGAGWRVVGVVTNTGAPTEMLAFTRGGARTDLFVPEFRRGFVEAVTCTAADWLAHRAAIRERRPVTRVNLTTRPETRVTTAGPPHNPHRRHRARLLPGKWREASEVLPLLPGATDGYQMRRHTGLAAALLTLDSPGVEFTLPPHIDLGQINALALESGLPLIQSWSMPLTWAESPLDPPDDDPGAGLTDGHVEITGYFDPADPDGTDHDEPEAPPQ